MFRGARLQSCREEGGGGLIDSEGHTMALKVGYWARS